MGIEINNTGSFVALDEKGTKYEVQIFTAFKTTTTRQGNSCNVFATNLKLNDGRHVNKVKHKEYEIVDFPLIKLVSHDPNAH